MAEVWSGVIGDSFKFIEMAQLEKAPVAQSNSLRLITK